MNGATVTGVSALLAVLVGAVDPCGAMEAQGAPAIGPDSDGDGIPDAQDPYPLIADFKVLTWYVSKIEVGWHVETEGTVTQTEGLTWERNKSKVEVKGDKQQILGEASASLGAKAQAELNVNPLRAFGFFDLKARAEFQAKAGLSYSGDWNWSATSRGESRRAYEYAQRLVSQTRLHDPYIEVWVEFCNHSEHDLTLTPESLTIFVGGKPMVEAEHAKKGALIIPAERPDGIPERFKATLDTTGTLGLLEGLKDGAPSVALERSRMVVRDPSGRDAISAARRIEGSTAEVRVSAGALSYSWRVACSDQARGQPITLRQALEAISERLRMGLGLGQLFIFKGDSLQSIAGTDAGSDKGQWFVSLGEGADQIIDSSALSRNLCAGGDVHFTFKSRDQLVDEDLQRAQVLLANTSVSDDSPAIERIRKYADQGDARAQLLLGRYYLQGQAVAKDPAEAVKWFRKAAEQGDAVAQAMLGYLYSQGEGVAKDQAEAVKWYRKAAEQGVEVAQESLGYLYSQGEGVPKDPAEAVKWFRKAAEQGSENAQYNLGYLYSQGQGVPKDPAEAVKWFRKAAEQGFAVAQAMLGYLYSQGEGVAKDQAEAVKWYRKAAEQGLADAQYSLGIRCDTGEGVAKDQAEAVKWYRKAAEQGLADAQFDLGISYATGGGVAKDQAKAVKWLRKAAEQGHSRAKEALRILGGN